ncbi:hypothetical protein MHF_1355 [Mycoplasma haemofelis Ohio2]|uniref:Uncharacterized protein n=1 Tax=Mycoplasma haemofelis (strain Ohio2) TaxID=859194 RepID=F6FG93_MYCHI|nr:hypothetical protein MHF_1355 [Mycoplasma haemofelis Ohio2]
MLFSFEKLIGAVGVGTTVGGGYLINSFIFPKTSSYKLTLSDLLEAAGLSPLDFDTTKTEGFDSVWDDVLSDYKKVVFDDDKNKDPEVKRLLSKGIRGLELETFSLGSDRNENINKLKRACSFASKMELKFEESSSDEGAAKYLLYRWCVSPKSAKSLLPIFQGNDPLNTETLDSFKKEFFKGKFSGTIRSYDWSRPEIEDDDQLIEDIWKRCKAFEQTTLHKQEFYEGFNKYSFWCSKSGFYHPFMDLQLGHGAELVNLFRKGYTEWKEGGRNAPFLKKWRELLRQKFNKEQTESFEQHLRYEGLSRLSKSDVNISEIFEAYRGSQKQLFGNLRDKDELLQKCRDPYANLTNASFWDQHLSELTRWCVVPYTVEQRINRNNYLTPLSSEEEWRQQAARLKNYNKDHFGQIVQEFSSMIEEKDEANKIKKLKEYCESKKKARSFEEGFDVAKSSVSSLCYAYRGPTS